MDIYTFKVPILKDSLKKIEIYNSKQEIVGVIQRYYNHTFQKMLEVVFSGAFYVHVKGKDCNNKLVCKIQKNNRLSFLRNKWEINSGNLGESVIRETTVINTNPSMEFDTLKYGLIKIKKDFGDRRVFFYDRNDSIIVEATYDKIVPPQTVTITMMLEEESSIIDFACLYYLFSLKG